MRHVKRIIYTYGFAAILMLANCGCLGGSMASSARIDLESDQAAYQSQRTTPNEDQGDNLLKLLAALVLAGGLVALITLQVIQQLEKEEKKDSRESEHTGASKQRQSTDSDVSSHTVGPTPHTHD